MSMKKIFLGVITLCMSCQAFSQKSIQASSKVTNVTVYLQGASVTRTASATLPAGAGEVVFTGLTTNINDKTVQISGKGDFTILSVVYSLNYVQTRQKQDKQKLLEDSLQLLNASLATNLNTQATYNGMAELLNSNKSIS